MSNDVVIKVENLSKLYKLGLIHHDRLAEAITAGLKRTSTSLRSLFSRESSSNAMPALWNAKPIPPGPSSSQSSSSNPMPSVYPVAPADDTGVSLEDLTGAQCAMPSSSDDTIWALRNVSFEVKRGEVLGIIGRNGAGKSTLLKILTGITEPTEGRVWMKGRVASLLEVGTGFHPELTGRENIFLNGAILGMTRVEIKQKFDEIVEFAEIEKFINTPVKRYSSGMHVRLAFAVAAHLEPEILLVDEVLAVGDVAFQRKCIGKMGEVVKGGRTILFVSHNMSAIAQLTKRCLVLDHGVLTFSDDTDDAIRNYLKAFVKTISMGRVPLENLPYKKRVQLDPKAQFVELGYAKGQSLEIRVGQNLKIEALIIANKIIEKLCFGFTIHDELGGPILTGYSPSFSLPSPGKYLREIVIKNLYLAPGDYELSISIHTGGLTETKYIYDIVLGFGHFMVKPVFEDSKPLDEWNRGWGRVIHMDMEVHNKSYEV